MQGFGVGAIATAKFEHLGDQAVESLGIVVNDAAEPLVQGIALFFRQQFGGMADRRQGIADFVRHVGRQAPQCGELHLLGLGTGSRGSERRG